MWVMEECFSSGSFFITRSVLEGVVICGVGVGGVGGGGVVVVVVGGGVVVVVGVVGVVAWSASFGDEEGEEEERPEFFIRAVGLFPRHKGEPGG